MNSLLDRMVSQYQGMLPRRLALTQASFEMMMKVGMARDQGATTKEIGRVLGITTLRVRQIFRRYDRAQDRGEVEPPINAFFAEVSDNYFLSGRLSPPCRTLWNVTTEALLRELEERGAIVMRGGYAAVYSKGFAAGKEERENGLQIG